MRVMVRRCDGFTVRQAARRWTFRQNPTLLLVSCITVYALSHNQLNIADTRGSAESALEGNVFPNVAQAQPACLLVCGRQGGHDYGGDEDTVNINSVPNLVRVVHRKRRQQCVLADPASATRRMQHDEQRRVCYRTRGVDDTLSEQPQLCTCFTTARVSPTAW